MPYADLGPITLEYETWGRRGDPTVLLIAGVGAQRVWWPEPFITRLVDHHLAVVAFDNRDAGRSTVLDGPVVRGAEVQRAFDGQPVDPPYTLADMATDAVGLLDHLGIASAHAVGASMGGMIAQHLAFSYPERTATLTSIMSRTGAETDGGRTPEANRVLMTPLPTRSEPSYVAASVRAQRALAGARFDEERARAKATDYYRRGVHPRGTARQMLAIAGDGDRTARLRTITVPTLVIHGAIDPLVDVSGGHATAAAIPGAQLVIHEDMGHDLPTHLLGTIADRVADHVRSAASAVAR